MEEMKKTTKLPNLYARFSKIYICQPLIHKIAHLNGREKSVKVLGGLLFLNIIDNWHSRTIFIIYREFKQANNLMGPIFEEEKQSDPCVKPESIT